MRKNAFNAKERILAINKFRIALNGKAFTKAQLLAVFKENHIPTNSNFWSEFRKSGIIKEASKESYVFASDKPVYFGDLDRVYRSYHNKIKKYSKKPATQQEVQKETQQETQPEAQDALDLEEEIQALEAFAIDFLKELGYEIFAPSAIVYEKV